MNEEQGRIEIIFQMTMRAAQRMLEKGTISEVEYREFDIKMQQKYAPIIGRLFSDIDLL